MTDRFESDPLASDLQSPAPAASRVRHLVIAVTALAAVLLYLHRFCMNYAQTFIQEDLALTDEQLGLCFSAFFLSYALAQVPSGWFSDRFGARAILTIYILSWSAFTALMGFTLGFVMLLVVRLGAGLAQAGAYPTAAAVVNKWTPFNFRGATSSLIALGGRVGGAIAPPATAAMIIWFVPLSTPVKLSAGDLLQPGLFAQRLFAPSESDSQSLLQARVYLSQRLLLEADEATRSALATAAEPKESNSATATVDPALLLVDLLNNAIEGEILYDEQAFAEASLGREAKSLIQTAQPGTQQARRLNRFLLETAYPQSIRKLYGKGWRPTMIAMGSVGLFVALLFFLIHRNRPSLHPRCNQAEVDTIERGRPKGVPDPHKRVGAVPIVELCKSRSIWLLCIAQFGTNVAWVFLVTWLPRYLLEVHHVPFEQRNVMVMVPLFVGWFGMLGGGWATDFLSRRISLRWSRAFPIVFSRLLGMSAYLLCLLDFSPWTMTALFAVVAFSTDFGSAPMWAFNQDVGGQHVGSVLGWGNMWGNLGAAVSPYLLTKVVMSFGWDGAFIAFAIAFLISGLCALGVDASKAIVKQAEETAGQ